LEISPEPVDPVILKNTPKFQTNEDQGDIKHKEFFGEDYYDDYIKPSYEGQANKEVREVSNQYVGNNSTYRQKRKMILNYTEELDE